MIGKDSAMKRGWKLTQSFFRMLVIQKSIIKEDNCRQYEKFSFCTTIKMSMKRYNAFGSWNPGHRSGDFLYLLRAEVCTTPSGCSWWSRRSLDLVSDVLHLHKPFHRRLPFEPGFLTAVCEKHDPKVSRKFNDVAIPNFKNSSLEVLNWCSNYAILESGK